MNYGRERVDRVALTMSTGVSINCCIFGEIFEVFYIQNLLKSPNCLFVVGTMNIITLYGIVCHIIVTIIVTKYIHISYVSN